MTTVPDTLDRRFRDAAAAAGLLDVAYDFADSPVGRLLVAASERGALGVEEALQVRRQFGEQRAPGRAEEEGLDELGPRHRRLDGHAGAEGRADEMAPLHAQVIECLEYVCGVRQLAIGLRRGVPEPAEVEPHRGS